MDPRGQALKRHATHMLQFKPGTDVALLNAMHARHRRGGALRPAVHPGPHRGLREAEGSICRTSRPRRWRRSAASTPRRSATVARAYATAQRAHHLLGHGHLPAHPRHRQRALPDRAGADERPGRPARHRAASAARPEQRAGRLRRRPDPDGASPTTSRSASDERRTRFEELWGTKLDPKPGLTVVEIMDAIHAGEIKGMYIMGENPAMSDPDAHHAREALAKLEHLVVQDLFLTETASYADVVLPASAWPEKDGTVTNTNRQVQMGRHGAAAARRGAPGLVDHPGDRAPHRPRLALRASARRLRRDGRGHAVARPTSPGSGSSARSSVTYPCDGARPAGPRHRVRRRLPDRRRARQVRAGRTCCRRTSCPTTTIRWC